MTYINPFLCDDVAQKRNHRRNLFGEAARNGYFVKNQEGEPYKITSSSFSAALVDVTNPEAWSRIKDINVLLPNNKHRRTQVSCDANAKWHPADRIGESLEYNYTAAHAGL